MANNTARMIFAVCVSIALSACSGGGGSDSSQTANQCSLEAKKEFVYELMKDSYLWSRHVPDVDISAYDSPAALMADLRYGELDRWSHTGSKSDSDNYYLEGKYLGLGYGVKYDEQGVCRIKFVYPDSPAGRAGLSRGDILLEINGISVDQITEDNLWDTVTGPEEIGEPVNLALITADNGKTGIQLRKDWVSVQPAVYHQIIDAGDLKIGYLVYNAFLDIGGEALDDVFRRFKREPVDELILDLRYNGGGTASAARYLASLIGGKNTSSSNLFAQFLHNDKYRWRDSSEYFLDPATELALDRVAVITTPETCSASELVISALEPYMEVIVIGDITCGKPVGMYQHDYCDMQASPVEFEILNANGEGAYYDGIPPACYAADDLTRPLGAAGENCLAAAVYYLTEGHCPDSETAREQIRRAGTASPRIRFQGLRKEINAL